MTLTACLAAVIVLLSGCGGGTLVSGTRAGPPASTGEYAAPVPMSSSMPGVSADADAGEAAGNRRSGGAPTGRRPQVPNGDTSTVDIRRADRAIVYTGELTVRAKDVTAAADRAKEIVTAAGGRLERETSTSQGNQGGATLVFKVPPEGYPGVLGQLGKDLGKRESLRQGTKDVTEQVADVESRLKSARSSLGQLRTLLTKAKTIGEVLSVEREISSREAELESLQARQRVLSTQTAMATLTLRLVGPVAVVPPRPAPDPPGFLRGLKSGWKALIGTVRFALTVLGALLPWLAVLGVLWLAFIVVRRRVRRRRAAARRAEPAGRPTPGTSPAVPREAEQDAPEREDTAPVVKGPEQPQPGGHDLGPTAPAREPIGREPGTPINTPPPAGERA